MHVLLFHHPFPMPTGAATNHAWTATLANFAQALLNSEPAPRVSVCLPARRAALFGSALGSYPLRGRHDLYLMDDRRIFEALAQSGMTVGQVDRLFYGDADAEIETLCRHFLPEAALGLDPSVVLGFGLSNAWLRRIFPKALVLDSENSSFSRTPFAKTVFFDHLGLFNRSALPQAMAAIARAEWTARPRARKIFDTVRKSSLQWARAAGGQLFGVRHGDAPRLLVAMQASGYSTFDAIVPFRSQFELLADVIVRVPPEVEVFATEHPTAWRHESRFLTGSEMQELGQAFPNLRFFERTGAFSQASQMLLPFVDGIWTISSNLAQVARLWRKAVGTPAGSHYAFLADATDVEGLCAALTDRSEDSLRQYDAFLTWQLQHYLVPRRLLQQPGWFLRYLEGRLAACRDDASVPNQFTRVASEPDSLLDVPAVRAGRPPVARQTSGYADLAMAALKASFKSNAQRARDGLDQRASQESEAVRQRFFLVNETARLNLYAHAGCNAVGETILREMWSRGFGLGAIINDREDFARAWEQPLPDLVVLNGEGSLHGGGARARNLLEWGEAFARRGTKVALINTVWQGNDREMAKSLSGFATVHCRESNSARSLRDLGIEAVVTPDLCFSGVWTQRTGERKAPIAVTDSVLRQTTMALYDAASRRSWPFLFMDMRSGDLVHSWGGEPIMVGGRSAISALAEPTAISAYQAIVTGRFHGAAFAIRQQIPFLAIPSNTFKTEGLLKDCGLAECLFSLEGYDGDPNRLAARMEAALDGLPPDFAEKCSRYSGQAWQGISTMFDEICGTRPRD